ncbi:MAG: DNA polymerase/3'-5' exonuclease PolX [Candidatus Omnitrophica bacterium]|nr:DNA polymerase/3'-5' exonuclease PolX [Candidatus Omnitrophota bacterium]
MPAHNNDIAEVMEKMANLIEIKGGNQYRIRAYRNAAQTVKNLSKSVSDMINKEEDLSTLPNIGKDLAGKIKKYVKKGAFPGIKQVERSVPPELNDIIRISGLGGKRVKKIYDALEVKTLEDLKKAGEEGKIRELKGFGEKTEQKILEGISTVEESGKRLKLSVAEKIISDLVEHLKKDKKVKNITVAGSNRRKKETVGDADILATCKKGSGVMDRFVDYEDVEKVIARGKTKSSIKLRSGFQVDLRVLPEVSYGAALVYFTGSKAHNIAIRKIAGKKKFKINEYGVFRGDKRIAGKTEKGVYGKIGLPYIAPELREDRGEVEAGKKGKLPELVSTDDIRGDLHVHTKLTDGKYTLEEMARAAKERGYEYVGVTEHSKHLTVAGGLKAKEVEREIRRVDKLNKKLRKITVLKGIEVDILEDGSLDLPDSILKELDYTVCAVHYKFGLSAKKQTERVLKAMDNKYFNILAHPTGRMLKEREAYEIDLEKIMREAKKRGCLLELNSHPERLDLNDVHCKMAKDIGVKIAVNTDAHSIGELEYIRYGIGQARRGWLEKKDIVNTGTMKQLKKALKRK